MKKPKRVFLLGASGMGMAPLAFFLRGAGVEVEAFDDYFREPLRSQMLEAGVEVLLEPVPHKKPDYIVIRVPSTDRIKTSWFHGTSSKIYKRGDFAENKSLKRWPLWEAMERLRPLECSPGLLQKIFHFLT